MNKIAMTDYQQEMRLIGEIAVGFGNLELYLEAGIWQLLGGQDKATILVAQALTAEMSFDRKVHAFASMYKLRVPTDADSAELKELISDLFEIQGERNAILHSAWSPSEAMQALARMKASAKAKEGLRRRLHAMTPARLEAIRVRIAQVGKRFAHFLLANIQDKSWGETA
jgi:hypothetical protein